MVFTPDTHSLDSRLGPPRHPCCWCCCWCQPSWPSNLFIEGAACKCGHQIEDCILGSHRCNPGEAQNMLGFNLQDSRAMKNSKGPAVGHSAHTSYPRGLGTDEAILAMLVQFWSVTTTPSFIKDLLHAPCHMQQLQELVCPINQSLVCQSKKLKHLSRRKQHNTAQ